MKIIALILFLFVSSFADAAITLTITRADGSVYWTEHFSKQTQGDAWLATEKTRSYWNPTYVPNLCGDILVAVDAPLDEEHPVIWCTVTWLTEVK